MTAAGGDPPRLAGQIQKPRSRAAAAEAPNASQSAFSQANARTASVRKAKMGAARVDLVVTSSRPGARRDLISLLAGYTRAATDRAMTLLTIVADS